MENRSHALIAGLFTVLLGLAALGALWWFGGFVVRIDLAQLRQTERMRHLLGHAPLARAAAKAAGGLHDGVKRFEGLSGPILSGHRAGWGWEVVRGQWPGMWPVTVLSSSNLSRYLMAMPK